MDNDMGGAPAMTAEFKREFEGMMSAFEEYKATNDQRVRDLETKSGADVVTTDKLARIDAVLDAQQRRMDDLSLKSQRPGLSGAAPVANERKAAFAGYMRGGAELGLRALERKALTGGTTDAGFTVPQDLETEVLRRLSLISPIRSIAGVRTVSTGTYKKPIATTRVGTGWVGETDDRTERAAPALAELSFQAMELYAMPAATSTLLDDSAVDLDTWLADEIEAVFAEQETRAFVRGDGIAQPKGFLSYETVADASWAWGKVGFLKTGVAGGFPTSAATDKLIDLVYALKAGYRQNAHFVMNRTTQAAVRKMKDGEGQYLWLPPAIPGARASLLNFPVVEAEDMPDMATDSLSIAFGDFRRGYLIVDRQGIQVLRDPYSDKPYVLFYTTKRVGGGIQDFEAIKLLKFSV